MADQEKPKFELLQGGGQGSPKPDATPVEIASSVLIRRSRVIRNPSTPESWAEDMRYVQTYFRDKVHQKNPVIISYLAELANQWPPEQTDIETMLTDEGKLANKGLSAVLEARLQQPFYQSEDLTYYAGPSGTNYLTIAKKPDPSGGQWSYTGNLYTPGEHGSWKVGQFFDLRLTPPTDIGRHPTAPIENTLDFISLIEPNKPIPFDILRTND